MSFKFSTSSDRLAPKMRCIKGTKKTKHAVGFDEGNIEGYDVRDVCLMWVWHLTLTSSGQRIPCGHRDTRPEQEDRMQGLLLTCAVVHSRIT
ncbi:hypothetical protein RRG08_019023 [Elysia crispata]|uniref:Uncharacterized protein n=1 Tax=Elysia crispata TaxID=231223 RepID=A0AAE1DSS5_9GAST|nr:hypothetical protein RRG08_019023 [Elysia crispata]